MLATATHLIYDLRYGVSLQGLAPLGYSAGTRAFWASLAILDPLCALLLFVRPRAGLILCVAIIVTDVVHNGFVGLWQFDPGFVLQAIFLTFVMATVRAAWRGLPAVGGGAASAGR